MIVDHTDPDYVRKWKGMFGNRYNGAYYYSREIVANIIPNVETTRNWVTVNQEGRCFDHSIVFVHNNLHPEMYSWLSAYDDLVLVCGVPSTCEKVAHLGRAVYLPLSVDVGYVERFRVFKTRDTAFCGRVEKRVGYDFGGIDMLYNIPRDELLTYMAMYERVYAVGRTAIEARILDCEILTYDPRYPDPSVWKVVDNLEAAEMLQNLLDD